MDTIIWYVLLGIVIVMMVAGLFLSRPRCPECHSYDISLMKKEPQKMNTYEAPGGGESGGSRFTASIFYRVRYRCNDCQETWEKDITESR